MDALLGDHEIGDDKWRPKQDAKKLRLVPQFKEAFRNHLKMPLNGPEHMKGTAFSFIHKNLLFVAVDVFEEDPEKGIAAKVTGKQLAWLDKNLSEHPDVEFTIVMGHTPILGPVREKSSSGLMLEKGRE